MITCKKLPYENPRIDQCLRGIVSEINQVGVYRTIASCCGHEVYPSTIVVKCPDCSIREYFSMKLLQKAKRHRYYKRDANGYYFIPGITRTGENNDTSKNASRKK